MLLNIIFDNRRPEKHRLLAAEMERQNIATIYWPAVILTSGIIESINASHKRLVSYAKFNNLPEFAIAEDDVYFPAENGWQHFLTSKPDAFDLYLGGCYSELIHDKGVTFTANPVGLHCYIIAQRYYDTFLATDPAVHIDTAQTNGLFKVCYPMVAIQRPGWSWNNKEIVNYNTNLNPKDVYDGIPTNML